MYNQYTYVQAPRDFSALRRRIREEYQYECQFADAIGMTKEQLSSRFNNKHPFTVGEIITICTLLHIPEDEIGSYFRVPLQRKEEVRSIRTVIREKFGSVPKLANAAGVPKHILFQRLNFHSEFRYGELRALANALQLTLDEVSSLIEMERGKLNG